MQLSKSIDTSKLFNLIPLLKDMTEKQQLQFKLMH